MWMMRALNNNNHNNNNNNNNNKKKKKKKKKKNFIYIALKSYNCPKRCTSFNFFSSNLKLLIPI